MENIEGSINIFWVGAWKDAQNEKLKYYNSLASALSDATSGITIVSLKKRETYTPKTNVDVIFLGDSKTLPEGSADGQFPVWNNTTQEYVATTIPATLGYSSYNALVVQASTSAPTATVMGTNDIGTIVWARSDTGVYTATLSAAFTENKTQVLILKGADDTGSLSGIWTSANVITVNHYDVDGAKADGFTAHVAIKVFA